LGEDVAKRVFIQVRAALQIQASAAPSGARDFADMRLCRVEQARFRPDASGFANS